MILVSGASGFIGRRLVSSLSSEGIAFRQLVRGPSRGFLSVNGDLADRKSLVQACSQVTGVFHCAGYAHAFSSMSGEDSAKHWAVNFEGTCNLLEVAAQAGVGFFVFLSSVKAMPEPGNACVDESFSGDPETAYGRSKLAAEQAVLELGRRYGIHVVNLRLAMVYGSGGRGNLERMGRLVKRRLFPPLPDTGNRRSLVHVDDLVSAARFVASDSRANGQTYIIASQHAPSGRGLFDAMRQALGLPPCLWSVSASLFWGGRGSVIGWRGLRGIVCHWIARWSTACSARLGILLRVLSVSWGGGRRCRLLMVCQKC